MQIILNIAIIGLVGLIAYWWSNQGAFSALLHCLCVVIAGAVALALWEPVTTAWLLSGGFFDNYIWGISLIGIFALTLLILRVTMDKTIRANIDLPPWMQWALGLPLGAVAGTITVGIIVLGCGFMQSTNEILGLKGAWRAGRTAEVGVERDQRMWFPVHEITYELYGWLSVTSLSTGTPLRHYYPRLDWQAVSLVRDTWGDGKGRLSQQQDDMTVTGLFQCSDCTPPHFAVKLHFKSTGHDYGEQLTLSRSQVWLVGEARGTASARMAFPDSWTQYDGWHKLDDRSHYATSEPGQQSSDVTFEFNAEDLRGQAPKFIMVRAVRYRLPAMQQASESELRTGSGLSAPADGGPTSIDGSAAGGDGSAPVTAIAQAIRLSNDIRPVNVSKNQMPSSIKEQERWLTDGDAEFSRGGDRPSRNLVIQGILEPAGTRVVKVNVSRNSAASIFGDVRDGQPPNAKLVLVDDRGREYLPMGFIHQRPDGVTRILLDPANNLRAVNDRIPELPTASEGHTLELVFTVTSGVTLTEFKLGDNVIGSFNLPVTARR